MGGSNSYGDLLFVFGKTSKSDGFNKKSAIALTGVMKFLSNDCADKSNLFLFVALPESEKKPIIWENFKYTH